MGRPRKQNGHGDELEIQGGRYDGLLMGINIAKGEPEDGSTLYFSTAFLEEACGHLPPHIKPFGGESFFAKHIETLPPETPFQKSGRRLLPLT